MELHEAKLTGTATVQYPKGNEIAIVPITDVQYGAQGCSVSALKAHIRWGVENDAYWVGLGEFGDFSSPSNQQRIAKLQAEAHDIVERTLTAAVYHDVKDIVSILRPTEGRWLGMLEGHHFHEFPPDEKTGVVKTSDQIIAEELGAPFLGTCALIHVKFRNGQVLKLWLHHGAGSGQTLGAPLLRLERVAARWDAHVYLVGHQHKIVPTPIPWLFAAHNGKRMTIVEQRKIVACCGGFLKGYEEGTMFHGRPRGGYVERGLLPPTGVGGLLIRAKATKHDGVPVFDLRVEF